MEWAEQGDLAQTEEYAENADRLKSIPQSANVAASEAKAVCLAREGEREHEGTTTHSMMIQLMIRRLAFVALLLCWLLSHHHRSRTD
jgi:hypothetical protein